MTNANYWLNRLQRSVQAEDPSAMRVAPEQAAEAIRALGADPVPDRVVHYRATAADGQAVMVRTNLPPDAAQSALAAQVLAVEETGMPEDRRRLEPRPRPMDRHLANLGAMVQMPAEALPHGVAATPVLAADAFPPWAAMAMHWHAQSLAAGYAMPQALAAGYAMPQAAPMPVMPHPASPRLLDSIATFLDWTDQKQLSRSGITEALFTLRVFSELVGNKYTAQITVADADLFLHAIQHWPPNASKRVAFRGMHAAQVVAKAKRLGEKSIHIRTQQTHIDRLRGYFRWLEHRREITPGLLKGVSVWKAQNDPGGHRHPFTDDDLRVIFAKEHADLFSNPYMYWIPLIALYQGMRLTEISQLYVEDVNLSGSTPSITVTSDRPGQRLKTRSARRVLAIHPKLVELGIESFVKQCKRWRRVTLFPGLTWGANGPGDLVSDWFNGAHLRRRCQIADSKRTFHSFRHNFATLAESSDVPWTRIAKLLGHQAGQNALQTFYFQPRPMELSLEDIRSIRFPVIDHAIYRPEQFEVAFEKASQREARRVRLDHIYGPRR